MLNEQAPERTADLARELIDGAPPTDSLPPDAGPSWLTIPEIGQKVAYREGLTPITSGFATIDRALRGGFRPESLYVIGGGRARPNRPWG